MIKEKPRALIISKRDPSTDPRPSRFSSLLYKEGYEIHTLSYQPVSSKALFFPAQCFQTKSFLTGRLGKPHPIISNIVFALLVTLPNSKIFKYFGFHCLRIHPLLRLCQTYDYYKIIVCHDPILALLILGLSDANVIYDLREFYPLQYDSTIIFRLLHRPLIKVILRTIFRFPATCIAVSKSQALLYWRFFKIKTHIIRSVPNVYNIQLSAGSKKARTRIKLVYHGSIDSSRNIANVAKCVCLYPDKYSLDIYAVGTQKQYLKLSLNTASMSNVTLHKPVPYNRIIPEISQYHIGLAFFTPVTTNLRFCLPNKVFEYLQAGLAIITGPTPDISNLVKRWNVGFVTKTFEIDSLYECLNLITTFHLDLIQESIIKARAQLCWEEESQLLTNILIP